MSSKISSTPLSTFSVNKLGYRLRPVSGIDHISPTLVDLKSRLSSDGSSVPQGGPVVIPVRLPSIAQRVSLYEAAGEARIQAMMNFDPESFDDYWFDEEDDLPEEGLSPYELSEHEIGVQASVARKKRADAKKGNPGTPLPGAGAEASQSTQQSHPEPTK